MVKLILRLPFGTAKVPVHQPNVGVPCRSRNVPPGAARGPENLALFADPGEDAISTGGQGFEPPFQIPPF